MTTAILLVLLQLNGIWVATLSGGVVETASVRNISPPGTFAQPQISPDGTQVAFWGKPTGASVFDIFVCDFDGSNLVNLTSNGKNHEAPQWSRDGTRLAYTEYFTGDPSDIFLMDPDGSNKVQLTNDAFANERPAWNDDDTQIIFTSFNRTGNGKDFLWRIDTNGSNLTQITSTSDKDYKASLSPDGTKLAWHCSPTAGADDRLCVSAYPTISQSEPIALLQGGDYVHGPFWKQDSATLLVHSIYGGVGANLYLVTFSTFPTLGTFTVFPVPGMATWGHGSFNTDEDRMSFDGLRSTSPPSGSRTPTPRTRAAFRGGL